MRLESRAGKLSWSLECVAVGIRLVDLDKSGREWRAEYTHWRSIVEAIVRLDVLPVSVASRLHHELIGSGLSKAQAHLVADQLRASVLSNLLPNEYLLRNGQKLPKDEIYFSDPGPDVNYEDKTDAVVLGEFIEFCEKCSGFVI